MTKNLTILGSTGSIGTQALEVVDNLGINIVALTANNNIDLLEEQIKRYKPSFVSVSSEALAKELKRRIESLPKLTTEILFGEEGLCEIARLDEADTVLTSIVGTAGLRPTMEAIKKGKTIALANKETLVAAGKIVMQSIKDYNAKILPVDSEHSAIMQCLMGNNENEIEKILLTASGGPFRGYTFDKLKDVTLEQALKHPNWSMGKKITVDSASMMNKGLEVIEARWLFDVLPKNIEVVVHPQSIIHSMVEFKDSAVIAQLGMPDMKVPIQLALTYPVRAKNSFPKLNIFDICTLDFEKPDLNTFRCLKLAFDSLSCSGTMPCVLNAANEISVDAFLKREINFIDIMYVIEKTMNKHDIIQKPTLDEVLESDRWARIMAKEIISGII